VSQCPAGRRRFESPEQAGRGLPCRATDRRPHRPAIRTPSAAAAPSERRSPVQDSPLPGVSRAPRFHAAPSYGPSLPIASCRRRRARRLSRGFGPRLLRPSACVPFRAEAIPIRPGRTCRPRTTEFRAPSRARRWIAIPCRRRVQATRQLPVRTAASGAPRNSPGGVGHAPCRAVPNRHQRPEACRRIARRIAAWDLHRAHNGRQVRQVPHRQRRRRRIIRARHEARSRVPVAARLDSLRARLVARLVHAAPAAGVGNVNSQFRNSQLPTDSQLPTANSQGSLDFGNWKLGVRLGVGSCGIGS
jgi:hypothetical protein